MMKKIALLFIMFAVLSCGNNMVEKPDNLISKEVMVDILYDLTVIQSAENLHTVEFTQDNIKVNELIYKKYNIDSAAFAQSNRYYAADPHNYQKIFKKVAEKIEANKKALNAQYEEETGRVAPTNTPGIQ